jgi:hypothetical protein
MSKETWKLTRRGERVLVGLMLVLTLAGLGLAGWIENGLA